MSTTGLSNTWDPFSNTTLEKKKENEREEKRRESESTGVKCAFAASVFLIVQAYELDEEWTNGYKYSIRHKIG